VDGGLATTLCVAGHVIIPEPPLAGLAEVVAKFLHTDVLQCLLLDSLGLVMPNHFEGFSHAANYVIRMIRVINENTVVIDANRIASGRSIQGKPCVVLKHTRNTDW